MMEMLPSERELNWTLLVEMPAYRIAFSLADPSTFQERCKIMMQKMVDTVPSGVTLTEPMQPREGKVYEAGYRFINGTLHFQAALRVSNIICV